MRVTTFCIDGRGDCVLLPPQISCISINPVHSTSSVTWLTLMPVRSDMATRVRLMSGPGLGRMVSLKGGLRRVVIQQLRLLGIVGFPIPRYDLQNGTLQMQKQTTSDWVSASNGWWFKWEKHVVTAHAFYYLGLRSVLLVPLLSATVSKYERSKILKKLRGYDEHSSILCLECGYEGLMRVEGKCVPWYLTWWVLIPIFLTGIDIVPAFYFIAL